MCGWSLISFWRILYVINHTQKSMFTVIRQHWGRLCEPVLSLITPSVLLIEQLSGSVSMVCGKIISWNIHQRTCRVPSVSSVYVKLQLETPLPAQTAKLRHSKGLWKKRHWFWNSKPSWKTSVVHDGTWQTVQWKFLVFSATFCDKQWGSGKRLGSGDLNSITVPSSSQHRT